MEKVVAWAIIIGASYGLVLFICNLIGDGIKLYDFLKSRRQHNGR